MLLQTHTHTQSIYLPWTLPLNPWQQTVTTLFSFLSPPPPPPPSPPPLKQPLLKFKINWLWHHVWLLGVTRRPGRDFYKVRSVPSISPLFLPRWYLVSLLLWLQCLPSATRGHMESTVVTVRGSLRARLAVSTCTLLTCSLSRNQSLF